MNFGEALERLKAGGRMRRKGWNGKGMYIFLTPGRAVPLDQWNGEIPKGIPKGMAEMEGIVIQPHIDMKTADGMLCIGWLASQADMLSEDWEECR